MMNALVFARHIVFSRSIKGKIKKVECARFVGSVPYPFLLKTEDSPKFTAPAQQIFLCNYDFHLPGSSVKNCFSFFKTLVFDFAAVRKFFDQFDATGKCVRSVVAEATG